MSLTNLCKLAICALILTTVVACTDNDSTSALNVDFTLSYEDSPLVSFDEKDYPLDYKVFFTKYSLYISDITLTSPEGPVKLADVAFMDLLKDAVDVSSAEAGQRLSFTEVPQRQYDGISFNIGVPADVNTTSPADYDPTTPLSNNSEYWAGWESYVFHKIEGQIDEDGDGETDTSVALHMGSDDAFRSIRVNVPIDISDDSETLKVDFDLLDVLALDGSYFDFKQTKQIHSLEVLPKIFPLLDSTRDKVSVTQL